MTIRARVLVSPRDDNPYQGLLYDEIVSRGWAVRYADGPTRSQTVNVLAKPALLALYRSQGYRLLHLHWVYEFSLPWGKSSRLLRRALQWWFGIYLYAARTLGYQIVWTAHNVVPHTQVFADDIAARRTLVRRASAVIALSPASIAPLNSLGADDIRVIPFGSYGGLYTTSMSRDAARDAIGLAPNEIGVLMLGKVDRYKGAARLLETAMELDDRHAFRIIIAGECADPTYRDELLELASRPTCAAIIRLERLSDEEMATFLRAADVAAFPFLTVTNSSSILLAFSSGLPAVIPAITQFDDVPRDAAIRYDATSPTGLREALQRAAGLSKDARDRLAQAGRTYSATADWSVVGTATEDLYVELLNR